MGKKVLNFSEGYCSIRSSYLSVPFGAARRICGHFFSTFLPNLSLPSPGDVDARAATSGPGIDNYDRILKKCFPGIFTSRMDEHPEVLVE
jgi:hypothetical protein